ncbi:MAG TPA: EAL domain-containing protein [Croceibacterium sp.]|jgi:diguanylate cyclase (GGDEF)-like protein
MFRVYSCIVHQHDLRLVVVAAIICLLASQVAFAYFERARGDGRHKPLWIAFAATVSGLGIWATHFIAMLAYQSDVPVGYDVATTLLSVAAAVLVTGVGWTIALVKRPALAAIGGGVVGAGVAVMHYIGMAAVKISGFMVWDRSLVTGSVVLGVVLAAAAVWASRRDSKVGNRLAPFVLTLAICGLHFTAMAAVSLYPGPVGVTPAGTVDSHTLAGAVTVVISLILIASCAALWFERRLTGLQLAEAKERAALAEQILQGAAERDALTAQLRREAAITSASLENMIHGLSVYDDDQKLVTFNRVYGELYGIPDRLLHTGASFGAIRKYLTEHATLRDPITYHEEIVAALAAGDGRFEVALSDGRIVEVRVRAMPAGGWLATHEDVTEARRTVSEIAYLATHDALTGLANRTAFAKQLDDALAEEQSAGLAVLTIDLDRFKEVNDTLGHSFGDQILKATAERLKRLVGLGDLITRLGGDEFAVIQREVAGEDVPAALADRIIGSLERPFEFEGHTIVIGASVGIALTPRDGANGAELLKKSDLALYRAKEESRGSYRFFEPGMDSRLRERRELEADLRTAIHEGQFEVHYQPLLDLRSGTIACFEALVRWNHPTRGMIQPDEFISIAEDTSLIIPIGEWVLRQACREAAHWPADVKVAVNLSPAQFKRGDLIAVTVNALATAQLAPERLELEITETVLLNDEAWVRSLLDRLHALGVRIALDDFGTGYSSLSYLRSFPFDKIKIDRSFVADVAQSADSRAIVQATIQLSEKLGMETTAEGVETAEQFDILGAEGCTHIQGFHISRAVPAADVETLLQQYGEPAAGEKRAAG